MIDLSRVANQLGPRPLTILSSGSGRDSQTMIAQAEAGELLVDGQKIGLSDLDAIAFSDLGYEWPLSYKAAAETAELARAHGIPFFWLRKPGAAEVRLYSERIYPEARRAVMARRKRTGKKHQVDRHETSPWRRRKWRSIEEKAAGGGYHRRLPILAEVMLLGRTTTRASAECTVAHKIEPIRELLGDLSLQRYGISNKEWGKGVKAGTLQPHRMLLGIAADEASRVRSWKPGNGSPWFVRDVYPLVEAGISKRDESRILADRGWGWVHKSGCMGCHYQPTSWFWMLGKQYPDVLQELIEVEEHSEAVRGRQGLKLLRIKGSAPLSEVVPRWGASTTVLKLQHRKGNLPRSFMNKLASVDPGYRLLGNGQWAAQARLGPDDLPSKLQEELMELLLSKGYDRSCGFGERN